LLALKLLSWLPDKFNYIKLSIATLSNAVIPVPVIVILVNAPFGKTTLVNPAAFSID